MYRHEAIALATKLHDAAHPDSTMAMAPHITMSPWIIDAILQAANNTWTLPVYEAPPPFPMVLHCPQCGEQHIDAPEPAIGWDNPPHRSHKCHECGTVWRPADVATVGVAATMTHGQNDTYPPRPNTAQARLDLTTMDLTAGDDQAQTEVSPLRAPVRTLAEVAATLPDPESPIPPLFPVSAEPPEVAASAPPLREVWLNVFTQEERDMLMTHPLTYITAARWVHAYGTCDNPGARVDELLQLAAKYAPNHPDASAPELPKEPVAWRRKDGTLIGQWIWSNSPEKPCSNDPERDALWQPVYAE